MSMACLRSMDIFRRRKVNCKFQQTPRKTIFDYVEPVFFQSRIIAIHPFTRDFHLSLISLLHSVLLMCLVFYAWLGNLLDPKEDFYDNVESTLAMVFIYAFLVLNLSLYKKLRNALDLTHRIDMYMISSGIEVRYDCRKVNYLLLWRTLIVLFIIVLDIYCYKFSLYSLKAVRTTFSYYYFHLLFDIIQLQYTVLVVSTGQHFDLLNKEISAKWSEALKTRLKLCQILLSHNRLYDVCELLQEYFSLHLLMFSACVFVDCTSHVYCIFDTLRTVWGGTEGDYDPRWTVFAMRFVYLAFRIYGQWWIVSPTNKLERNAHEFNNIIARLVISERCPIHNNVLNTHLSLKHDLQFWAAGFFRMDYTLFHTMVSAAGTYITLLIQFTPEKQENRNKRS